MSKPEEKAKTIEELKVLEIIGEVRGTPLKGKWIPFEEYQKLEEDNNALTHAGQILSDLLEQARVSKEEINEQLKALHDSRKEYIAELEKQLEQARQDVEMWKKNNAGKTIGLKHL